MDTGTKNKSFADALFDTNFQSKLASELWIRLGEKEFRLVGKSVRIGRAMDNDIIVDDKSCSRYHAVITLEENEVIIEDLKSRNGVRVRGKKVQRATLKDKDRVEVGDLVGLFFSRPKQSRGAPNPNDQTLTGHHESPAGTVAAKGLKGKFQSLEPRQRLMLVGGGVLAAALLAVFGLGQEQTQPLPPVAAAQENYNCDESKVTMAEVSKEDFERCQVHEDLGNFRLARTCFQRLPNTLAVCQAMARVKRNQSQLAQSRYEDGERAFENYYYDVAILKWQEVLLIADDGSDFRSRAAQGIQKAQERRRSRQ